MTHSLSSDTPFNPNETTMDPDNNPVAIEVEKRMATRYDGTGPDCVSPRAAPYISSNRSEASTPNTLLSPAQRDHGDSFPPLQPQPPAVPFKIVDFPARKEIVERLGRLEREYEQLLQQQNENQECIYPVDGGWFEWLQKQKSSHAAQLGPVFPSIETSSRVSEKERLPNSASPLPSKVGWK